jgi:esterase/lipase
MDEVRKNLKKIEVPTLIIHAKEDPVVHYKSSEIIRDKISSERKEFAIIDADKHVIITNEKTRDSVFNKIYEFIKNIH